MIEIGSVLDEKYEILKQIGTGGMSRVYLALDLRLKKQWAVKEVSKQENGQNDAVILSGLLAEAEIMKRLDHPALPRIVDILEDADRLCIVMDYIEGEPLDRILKEHGALPEELVVNWAKQIGDALLYLHSRKPPIIYRDMKPSNVILGPEGNIKIIDFGIAREYKERSRADTTVLGTRGYASPEHYGARQTDARSDIYTLGMTLHHLLTDVSPRAPGYVYHPVRYWNPKISEGLNIVIDRCAALDPKERYPDCRALLYDLEHISHLTADHQKKQKRHLRMFLMTASLAAVLFTAGFSFRLGETYLTRERYLSLLSVLSSLSLEEKWNNYEEAIAIRPADPTAYLRLVEAIEEEGTFDRAVSDAILSLYNENREQLDASSAAVEELNYRIGILYFTYYTDGEEGGSFSARVQKAYPFFAANQEDAEEAEAFEDRDLSACYFRFCCVYRSYVLSPVGGSEAGRDDYLELIRAMDECVDLVLSASHYDQLALYNGIFLLLYDQREGMAAVDVPEEQVLGLLDRVWSRTVVLSVTKEESAALQTEILDHYRVYREAVERTYDYKEVRDD